MDRKLAELLIEQDPTNEAEIYEEYSGRGMYGKSTTGVVANDALALFVNLLEAVADGYVSVEDLEEIEFGELSTDSMGLDLIVY